MKSFAVLSFFLFAQLTALAYDREQVPQSGQTASAPLPRGDQAATPPPDVSSQPVADPSLTQLPTEILVHSGRLSAAPDAKGKPTAGDLVELKITPSSDQGTGAKLHSLLEEQLKKGPAEWGDGRILWWKPYDPKTGVIVVGITSYSPGKFAIKAIPFEKDGKPVFASGAKEIEFASVGGDKSKDDIYSPAGIGLPVWFLIALAFFSLALVLTALHWLSKWYRRRKDVAQALATAPKILTPIEQFDKSRHETDGKSLVAKGSFKPHYFALSDAAKRLLGQAFRFDAEERTTRELLRELEGLGMSVELLDRWEHLLDEMDVTKFTDQLPEEAGAHSLSERLGQIVAASWAVSPAARELRELQQMQRKKGAK